MGLPNLNMKGKTKWILVLVVKRRHRANGDTLAKTSSRMKTAITFSSQKGRWFTREHYQLGKSRTRSRPRLRASSRLFVSDTSPKFTLGRRHPGTRQSATYILSIRFIRKCARIIPADTWRCYRCLVAAWIMVTWHRKKRCGYQVFFRSIKLSS